jgi:hypothetical protein
VSWVVADRRLDMDRMRAECDRVEKLLQVEG